jgi:hypothetical protein
MAGMIGFEIGTLLAGIGLNTSGTRAEKIA